VALVAQSQARKKTEAEGALEELVALARRLDEERLRSALDYIRFLNDEEDWPVPDAEEREDVKAFLRGETGRFSTIEEVRSRLDGEQ